jgi:hypothetical protein
MGLLRKSKQAPETRDLEQVKARLDNVEGRLKFLEQTVKVVKREA